MELRFKVSLNKDEYLHLITLMNRQRGKGSLTVDLWVILVSLGGLIVATSVCAMASASPVAGGGFLTGVLLVAIGLGLGRSVHQMWDNNEVIRAEREGT